MLIIPYVNYLSLEKKYSAHTTEAYKRDLKAFFKYIEKTKPTEDFTSLDVSQMEIKSWLIELSEQSISFKSINRKLSALKSFYSFLKKTGQIESNPFTHGLQPLKTGKRMKLPFSEDEIEEVLSRFTDKGGFDEIRNKTIVEVLYGTGIRRTELINLKVSDLDFSQKQLKVLGKRNKERILPMLPSVEEVLSEYLKQRAEVATEESSDFLFLVKSGKKIYTTLVYRIINTYFSDVTTKQDKSPHVMRHSFATHMLDNGADLNTVKELLGHSSLASTEVYTHTSLKELQKQYDKAHPRSNKEK
ncbi:MAG: tyrosine-type recombinase/integrase [Capnocytophaga sp.]|nr:tyrosine-type recombinase/integrase [Capnocytophaga sp.]